MNITLLSSEITNQTSPGLSRFPDIHTEYLERMISSVIFALLLYVSASDAGVSYVRWGRTVCPDGNIKLYNGFMVGAPYQGKGNGGNYLCSPDQPKFTRGKAGFQETAGWGGRIVGMVFQYDAGFNGLFLTDNIPGGVLHNQNMVCSVCHVPDSSDTIMIPGRDDCYKTGYDLQYKGFLVAQANWADRLTQEYVCMDEDPEGRMGGLGGDNNNGIYPVQFQCGSLPCNPYVDGMEATCAVCAY